MEIKINFVKYRRLYYIFSGILILLSLISLISFGLKPGIDLAGGSIMDLSFTNNRPSNQDIEAMLKEGFKDYPRCRLLVIANENNIPEAVGGILGLSSVVITSPESISMICEAVSSGKQVLVFKSPGLSKKHGSFLKYFAQRKYLRLVPSDKLKEAVKNALLQREHPSLNDSALIREALNKIL